MFTHLCDIAIYVLFFYQSTKKPEGKYQHLILKELGYDLEIGMVPDKNLVFALTSKPGKNRLYDSVERRLIMSEENDRQKNVRILGRADILRKEGLKILADRLCESSVDSNQKLGKKLKQEIDGL